MNAAGREHEPIIRAEDAGVYYWLKRGVLRREKFWALRNVSFELRRGESLGVIGRNGVGKSTLLRLLAGVTVPDEGRIDLKGTVNLMTLQLGFVPYLSGRENAIMSGLLFGLSRRDIEANMDWIVDFAGLGDFIDQRLDTYSSGMKARLGFAVAYQADPDVLLIDEVFGVGDSEFRARSTALLRERVRSEKTVVMVSHNSTFIKANCTRAIWIESGRVVAEGAAEEVVDRYEALIRSERAKAWSEVLPEAVRNRPANDS